MENRYNRQVLLPGFGPEAQQKLTDAKVLVVGAGGLGVPVLQYLTGMGVGCLGLLDGDTINLTNLHRQVLYNQDEVGQLKVEVAARKLKQLNPTVQFNVYPFPLLPENALELIKEYDLVVDATDNFEARYLINDACVILKKPFVYGALHQFEGQVSVFNHQGGPTYRCLYPNTPSVSEIPDCNTAGVLGVVPGLVGCQQALEAVKVLTGIGKSISGSLIMFDYLNQTQYKVKLKAKPENQNIQQLQPSYALNSCSSVSEISVEQLYDLLSGKDKLMLIDVREPSEFAQEHLLNAVSMPLSTFASNISSVPIDKQLVIICQKGGRSIKAAEQLLASNSDCEVYSVKGGMDMWLQKYGEQLVASEKQIL